MESTRAPSLPDLDSLGSYCSGSFSGQQGTIIFHQSWHPSARPYRGIVVVSHGLGEHCNRYANLYRHLLQAGYICASLDHRGYGRSGGLRGHVRRFSDYRLDLQQLIGLTRQTDPALPLALYGHSMGGLIVLDYAIALPQSIDFLIVAAPALATPPRASHLLLLAVRLLSYLYPSCSFHNRGSAPVSRDPRVVEAFDRDPLATNRVTARGATEIMAAQRRLSRQAADLTVPVLFLQGDADTVVLPTQTAHFFAQVAASDKTLLRYADYYHELHIDLDHQRPLADLVRWLDQRTLRCLDGDLWRLRHGPKKAQSRDSDL